MSGESPAPAPADSEACVPPPTSAGALGWIVIDGVEAPLAGATADAFPPADRPTELGLPAPAYAGDFGEFVSAASDTSQLFNDVKKCAACGKVCAVTMKACNGCGASLVETPITKTNNVFLGFVHGVAKGPFPFRISTRSETERMLVFDDPLAITRAHTCAIPTDTYVPDMRTLFAHPAGGLALLNAMDDAAWEALQTNYLDNAPFVTKALSAAARALPREALRAHAIAGLNFPPSQFQIHLQYMLPPFTPFHAGMYKAGAHYTPMRFFPLEFVRAALGAAIALGSSATPPPPSWEPQSLDAEALVAYVRDHLGVDYESIHAECYARYAASHALFANYDVADFAYAVLPGGRVVDVAPPHAPAVGPGAADAKALESADKAVLQSYGRPYDEAGKPGGAYYSHATRPAPLPTLSD